MEKDTYGNEVSRLGRPLPVEYLLLDVPASTPVTPTYTFNSDPAKQPFPVENRLLDGDIQDFNALNQYLSQFNSNEFFTAINDFHLLLYIATMDMLPMKEYMGPLLRALKNRDAAAAEEWSSSEHWATIEQLIAASSPPPSRQRSLGERERGGQLLQRGPGEVDVPPLHFPEHVGGEQLRNVQSSQVHVPLRLTRACTKLDDVMSWK
ncbi:hypothetical protein MTP99_007248 [Tenebrio molitor]|nr:hypothetical protein MTP99_007248 [Tenebrio molitor]